MTSIADSFVKPSLDGLVASPRAGCGDLHKEFEDTLNVVLGLDSASALVRHVEEVRLDHVERREQDIERSDVQLPGSVFLGPCPNRDGQIERNRLMLGAE
jgi:hypothetical protein